MATIRLDGFCCRGTPQKICTQSEGWHCDFLTCLLVDMNAHVFFGVMLRGKKNTWHCLAAKHTAWTLIWTHVNHGPVPYSFLAARHAQGCKCPTILFHLRSFKLGIATWSRYLVIPNHTNGLVACCALALVRTLMWNTIYSKQPRLSRNTVGCYNAGSVLSNTACAISKQLFLQQPASLHSTDLYTENIYKNMTFNFESLFVALWGLHQARIGQRNGMIFCTSGICVWITGPVPVEFLLGHRSVWFNTGNLLLTLQIYLPNAGWGEHLRGIHFQQIVPVGAHNKLGTQNWKCSAGSKLWITGKVLREMRFNGMLCFRLS